MSDLQRTVWLGGMVGQKETDYKGCEVDNKKKEEKSHFFASSPKLVALQSGCLEEGQPPTFWLVRISHQLRQCQV
ncbi:MAG: hypothetical protein CSA33_01970 [Desulfobulbus propionicus]|nr:MAG: hypothetical protein CSA33_01970 [Desulfobulbus propionicus]